MRTPGHAESIWEQTSSWLQKRLASSQALVKGKSVYDMTSRGRLVRRFLYMLLCTCGLTFLAPAQPAALRRDACLPSQQES